MCVCVEFSPANVILLHLDCSFWSNVLSTDLPVELCSLNGDFPEHCTVWLYYIYSVFVLFQRSTANKEQSTFSHQATFEANWVYMSNRFAAGHGESVMIERRVPLVATECN